MYTEEETDLIVLSCISELNYKLRYMLLSELKAAKPDFNKFGQILIKSLSSGVYNKVRDKFYGNTYREKVFKALSDKDITCVTYFSQDYPEFLKHTPFPPITLFCKGNTKLLKTRCFSVVGSRNTPANALAGCRKISGELTKHFTVVTGIAEGADTEAVNGAIDSGKCICVLANGFDHYYPACNRQLIDKVSEKGLLISEYTPDIKPRQYMFPVRNRIIAGISEATLVVSASERSGALITAEYAVEYGRMLFSFPYGIGVSSGTGCNSLIKKGAFLTENILDIFSVFGLDFKISEPPRLSEDEKKVLESIRKTGEIFVGDIAAELKKQSFELIPIISSLEIKGLIVRMGGNRYAVV